MLLQSLTLNPWLSHKISSLDVYIRLNVDSDIKSNLKLRIRKSEQGDIWISQKEGSSSKRPLDRNLRYWFILDWQVWTEENRLYWWRKWLWTKIFRSLVALLNRNRLQPWSNISCACNNQVCAQQLMSSKHCENIAVLTCENSWYSSFPKLMTQNLRIFSKSNVFNAIKTTLALPLNEYCK